MSDCQDHIHPLKRPGTSQQNRIIEALQPTSAPMHEWGMEAYLKFTYEYSRHVRFFDTKNATLPMGNWQAFFEAFSSDEEIQSLIKKVEKSEGKLTPHQSLFIAFLYLLKRSQDHLNLFTGRHLQFYYEKVLGLSQKAPVSDEVHIVFELAKNAVMEKVPEGTALNGNKDKNGKLRYYKTSDELVVNASKVGKLHNILYLKNDLEEGDMAAGLYHAQNANKADGLEAEPTDGLWPPFGHDKLTTPKVGLTVASPLLELKEGNRWIQIDAKLDPELIPSGTTINISADELSRYFEVFLTGEKGWLGPFLLNADPSDIPDVGSEDIALENSEMSKNRLNLLFGIPTTVDPIVGLDTNVITEPIQTTYPVARIVFKFNQESDADKAKVFQLYQYWSMLKIENIHMNVWVSGMKELIVENDLGPVDPSKAFFPFGSIPTRGSNMFVGNHEVFDKNWQKVNIGVTWNDLPQDEDNETDFRSYYAAYRKNHLKNISQEKYTLDNTKIDDDTTDGGRVVEDNNHFLTDISILDQKQWRKLGGLNEDEYNFNLFTDGTSQSFEITRDGASSEDATEIGSTAAGSTADIFYWGVPFVYYFPTTDTYNLSIEESYTVGNYNTVFNLELLQFSAVPLSKASQNLDTSQQKGFIKFSLQNHFYHKNYASIYTAAVAKDDEKIILPNEPYTPQIESITMDYFATTRTGDALSPQPVKFPPGDDQKKAILDSYSQDSVQLFHQLPFGYARQHAFLKDQALRMHVPEKTEFNEVPDNHIRLAPGFYEVGQFTIGLENIKGNQTVSLLFQVAEGSENPMLDPFDDGDEIEWSVLSSNEWLYLNTNYLLEDTTNNLLQSGIIRFLIPQEATTFNTSLEAGYIWLRATIKKHPDRVPKMIALHTNAVKARFDNRGNELSHLESALLPETITKMINRLAKIKKVTQPYASFDGKPKEKESDYHKRVSERLRHKQRAVALWDYEQLVLEEFAEIHKVKNLNHTRYNDESDTINTFSPGDVTMVVVPDLRNKNFYDQLQPRVSKNTLSEVESFLEPLHSMHVNFRAINPQYEAVKFEVEVVFLPDKDPILYKQQLNSDLIAYLSPWVNDPEEGIRFGGTVHKSQVIQYIEQLNYIDYITDFIMLLEGSPVDSGMIEAQSAASILVSAPEHKVENSIPEVCPS